MQMVSFFHIAIRLSQWNCGSTYVAHSLTAHFILWRHISFHSFFLSWTNLLGLVNFAARTIGKQNKSALFDIVYSMCVQRTASNRIHVQCPDCMCVCTTCVLVPSLSSLYRMRNGIFSFCFFCVCVWISSRMYAHVRKMREWIKYDFWFELSMPTKKRT